MVLGAHASLTRSPSWFPVPPYVELDVCSELSSILSTDRKSFTVGRSRPASVLCESAEIITNRFDSRNVSDDDSAGKIFGWLLLIYLQFRCQVCCCWASFFSRLPWNLTYDFELWTLIVSRWTSSPNMYVKDRLAQQLLSQSHKKVTHSRPFALPGPLKWLVITDSAI